MRKKLVARVATAVAMAGLSAASDSSVGSWNAGTRHDNKMAKIAIAEGRFEVVEVLGCSRRLKEEARICLAAKLVAEEAQKCAESAKLEVLGGAVIELREAWGTIPLAASSESPLYHSSAKGLVDKPVIYSGEHIGMRRDAALQHKVESRAGRKRPKYRYKDPRPVNVECSAPTPSFFDGLVAFVAKGDGGEGFRRKLEESRAKFASEDPMLHHGPPCEFCDLALSHDALGQRLLVMILQDEGYEAYFVGRVTVIKDAESINWATIRAKLVELAA